MRGAAAGRFRPRRIDGRIALLDVDDPTFFIDHESGSIGHPDFGQQDAVIGGYLTFGEIAEEGKLHAILGSEFFLGWGIVCTDSKNLGFRSIKFCDTRLVREHFLGSATGEGGRKEGKNDIAFAAEITQLHFAACGGCEREIRSHVAFLEVGFGRRLALGIEPGGQQRAADEAANGQCSHGYFPLRGVSRLAFQGPPAQSRRYIATVYVASSTD